MPWKLPPLACTGAALRQLARCWRPVGLAFVVLLGPLQVLLALDPVTAGAFELELLPGESLGASDLLASLLYLLVEPALTLVVLRRLLATPAGSAPTPVGGPRLAGLYLTLLAVDFLRVLLVGVAAVFVVLLPPVVAWLFLAELPAVQEGQTNPVSCLQRSRQLVSGHAGQLLLALLPLGGPWLALKGLVAFGPPLSSGVGLAANVGLDLLGLGLIALASEVYVRLTLPPAVRESDAASGTSPAPTGP